MNEIEKLKNSLSMTTKEFAEHFGIPYNTVRQWVNGERKCPEYVISMLQKLIEYKTQGKQVGIFEKKYYCIKYKTIYGHEYQYNMYDEEWKRTRTLKCFFTDKNLYEMIELFEL